MKSGPHINTTLECSKLSMKRFRISSSFINIISRYRRALSKKDYNIDGQEDRIQKESDPDDLWDD